MPLSRNDMDAFGVLAKHQIADIVLVSGDGMASLREKQRSRQGKPVRILY